MKDTLKTPLLVVWGTGLTPPPISSHVGYQDMEEFISTVEDERSSDLLLGAINRNRPFRRFKETLIDLPELRDQWFVFHDRTMRRRAISG